MADKINILVVEDDLVDSTQIERIIHRSSLSAEVTAAGCLDKVLELLRSNRFDVVLLDLYLPDSGGLDTLITLSKEQPSAAIVVITGQGSEEIGIKAIAQGADDFLIKGEFDTQDLTKSIYYSIERKKLREALRENEIKLNIISNNTCQFIGLLTVDGTLIYANKAALDFAGVQQSDLLNKPFWDCPWWTHSRAMQERLKDAIKRAARGNFVRFEATHHNKDKALTYVDFSLKPVKDKNGKVVFLVPEGRDVTDRKQVENALIQERNKSKQYLDMAGAMMVVINNGDTLGLINNKGCEILGYNEEEILGKNWCDNFVPQQCREEVKKALKGVMLGETNKYEYYENPVLTKDGQQRIIAWHNVVLWDESEKNYAVLSSGEDVTDRKLAEEEREKILLLQQGVNSLQQSLLKIASLEEKLIKVTADIVKLFDADFCRVWLIKKGDLCQQGCIHAEANEGPHVCRYRDRCLHLVSSSGRYTHIDGKSHRRVPFGCYKIGRVASDEDHKFLTNNVQNDPRVHNHQWARELGLVSFAGYQLRIEGGQTLGVLALFSKHPIHASEDAMLDGISSTVAMAIQQDIMSKQLQESEEKYRELFESSNDAIMTKESTS